jgi:HPt (histidine-containing phosphotransfer) domain-containing protein
MKQRYLERRKADFVLVSDAVTRGDFETLMRVGHQIKGNASTFGYADLEEMAKDLEESGRLSDIAQAQGLVKKMAAWLENQPAPVT